MLLWSKPNLFSMHVLAGVETLDVASAKDLIRFELNFGVILMS